MRRGEGKLANMINDNSSESDSDGERDFKRARRDKRQTSDEPDNRQNGRTIVFDEERNPGVEVNGRNGVIHKQKSAISPKPKLIPLESATEREPKPIIAFDFSAKEIMKQMGFEKPHGLGRRMTSTDNWISPERLQQMEDYFKAHRMELPDDVDFDEELEVDEEIRWAQPSFPVYSIDHSSLMEGRKTGAQKLGTSNETRFVDPDSLRKVSILKKGFECLTEYEYQQVRARSNPFETIGKGPFICRAAMKLANLDAVLSYALTQPTTNSSDRQAMLTANELFHFADVCAGPGGFTEYILYRKKWTAKGVGMTLKGKLDFDTGSFQCAPSESFEPFYGPADDGNVYNPDNTNAFIQYILATTGGGDNRGVHLMTADGGFEVDNKELTEIVSAQIYLAQCYIALSIVRPGGMFVCKFFDTLTPFSVGLIYLMYHSFELVAIHKPKTSRPANSERYLVCKWKKKEHDGITNYLRNCHELYWKWTSQSFKPTREAILELVPSYVLEDSKEFVEYITKMNTIIVRQQEKYLKRMVIFARQTNLRDPRQDDIKRKCFDAWKLPMSPKTQVQVLNAASSFHRLAGQSSAISSSFIASEEHVLREQDLDAKIKSPYDWRVVVIQADGRAGSRGFYLSLGLNKTFFHDGKTWSLCNEKLELCKDTIVYGEFVDEISGKKPSQSVKKTFHIIDAMILGGTDVRDMHYTLRHEHCVKFAKAMNKPGMHELCRVRTKIPVRAENIADIFDRLENRVISRSGPSSQLVCPVDHTDETLPFIKPVGILFLKITKDPWTMALSKSSNRKYYFNFQTGESKYDLVPESISSFEFTMRNRMVWIWDRELKTILATQEVTADGRPVAMQSPTTLNPQTLLRFVGGQWQLNQQNGMRRLSSSSSNQSSS